MKKESIQMKYNKRKVKSKQKPILFYPLSKINIKPLCSIKWNLLYIESFEEKIYPDFPALECDISNT